MSSPALILPRNFNKDKLIISEDIIVPKNKGSGGSTNVSVRYGDQNTVLKIQTEKMYVPWGFSPSTMNQAPNTPVSKYKVQLSFRGENEGKVGSRIADLRKCISQMDEKLLDVAFRNKEKWWGAKAWGTKSKKTKESFEEENVYSCISYSNDPQYADTMVIGMRMETKNGNTRPKSSFFFDKNGNKMTWDEVKDLKQFYAKCSFTVSGAWISKSLKKIGFFVNLSQMQIFPGESSNSKMNFLTYSDDEGEDEEENVDDDFEDDELGSEGEIDVHIGDDGAVLPDEDD